MIISKDCDEILSQT